MSETNIVVIGGKGTAINIAEQIEDARQRFKCPVRCVGLAIDDPSLGSSVDGFPVLSGTRDAWPTLKEYGFKFLYCLYKPEVLAQRFDLLQSLGIPEGEFATFVHPLAYKSPTASIGAGGVVLSGAALQSCVNVGRYTIVNTGAVIEHDAVVSDGCFVAAHACVGARAKVGRSVFIGLSATIREDVRIHDGAFVGMSAGVLTDVGPGAMVYGLPARERR